MKYSCPFPLRCAKLIAAYVEKHMEQYSGDAVYMVRVVLPDRVRQILDDELASLGLSASVGTVAFKRNTAAQFDKGQHTHVDYNEHNDAITNASIIVPVSGCDGTGMYWASGDYTLTKSRDYMGNARMDVHWNRPAVIAHEQTIVEPTLVRVNIPHGAYSRQDGSYRLILSIRLEQNEPFDHIVSRLP